MKEGEEGKDRKEGEEGKDRKEGGGKRYEGRRRKEG